MIEITNVLATGGMESGVAHLMTWLTPAAAYAALAFVGLRTIWDYLNKRGWTKRKNGAGNGTSESVSGEVDMKIIEGLRSDIQRIFDKLDELQRKVLENYCTKEEADAMRAELRDTRDRMIRLEADRDAMKAQIASLPKRSGDST